MTFQPEAQLFLQLPLASSERVLNPGVCTEFSAGDSVTGLFEDPMLEIAAQDELLLYFNRGAEFYKQQAKVVTVEKEAEGLKIELELFGDPASADSREHFRASTYREDAFAALSDEARCDVVDVSSTGFAIYSEKERAPGTLLEVTFSFEGELATGRASLQSVRLLGGGQYRYGMHCVEASGSPLRKLLLSSSMTLQRRMLTRMSGRA